jgi:hypothetical protein
MSTLNFRDEAVNFLAKPENLEIALDVADLIEDVKNGLIKQFWEALADRISKAQAGLLGWTLKVDPYEVLAKPSSYAGLDLVPEITSLNSPYLKLRVERNAGHQIYQGVCWSQEMKPPDKLFGDTPQIGQISNNLRLLSDQYSRPDNWWIGWKYLNDKKSLREKSALLRMEELAIEVSDEFLYLARSVGESVKKANSKLGGN